MVVNASGICYLWEVMPHDLICANHIPDRLSDELDRRRVNHNTTKDLLQEVVNLSVPEESLIHIVDKLRILAADKIRSYQVEIYAILKKYGHYVRTQARKKKI